MGHSFQSDLRRWDIVAGLCQACDARTYVEVGCKDGKTTGFVLENCPQARAIAIDPWREQPASDDVSRETYSDWDFRKIEGDFWKNIGDAKDRCKMLRVDSECAALEHFEQNTAPAGLRRQFNGYDYQPVASLDLVFIDALHDYQSVKLDIALWWPRVRAGGYLAGHDYNHKWPGVMRAVAEHFNLMDVRLGSDSVWWVQKPERDADLRLGVWKRDAVEDAV